jgi:hypothetical protein
MVAVAVCLVCASMYVCVCVWVRARLCVRVYMCVCALGRVYVCVSGATVVVCGYLPYLSGVTVVVCMCVRVCVSGATVVVCDYLPCYSRVWRLLYVITSIVTVGCDGCCMWLPPLFQAGVTGGRPGITSTQLAAALQMATGSSPGGASGSVRTFREVPNGCLHMVA